MASNTDDRTTITVKRDTHRAFKSAKPYDSMSADEFVDVLLDRWEDRR